MKTKILILGLLLSLSSKAQQATAYTNFTANVNLSNKDVYVFVVPQPFKYTRGATYVFAPIDLKKKAELAIEKKLKSWDPEWSGLYVNQLIEGVSLLSYQETVENIKNKIGEIYKRQQALSYRGKDTEIIIMDPGSGNILSSTALKASRNDTGNGHQGNAY